jgi:acyl carrier protein
MMKRSHLLVLSTFLITGIMAWWWWPVSKPVGSSVDPSQGETVRSRARRIAPEARTLERVRTAAQRKLPEVRFDHKEDLPFAGIDPGIDELDVMEILLEVETEFGIDIPQVAINRQVAAEHRRDLRGHLSLSLIAECVDGILRNPEH